MIEIGEELIVEEPVTEEEKLVIKELTTNKGIKIENIIIPKGIKYLGDPKLGLKCLPINCILNKGMTGCGGTELAIRNKVSTIIAMPFISLVKNKQSQHPKTLLGVYGNTTEGEIIEYIKTHKVLKIAIVYDSLSKLIKILDELKIDTKSIFLLVDEWHTLMSAYSYRKDAINNLIKHTSRFKNITYMSATPLDNEFILDELKGYKICNIIWQEKEQIDIFANQTNNPLLYIKHLITEYLREPKSTNIHLFANSVTFISKIVNDLKLDTSLVRIVCSKSNGNNQLKIGSKYYIEDITSPVKKINFYTSTAFEGCDIYDKEGMTFIISDGNKRSMRTNIRIQFVQICGRIRDSKYKNQINYIYKTNSNKSKTKYSHYKAVLNKSANDGQKYCRQFNSNPESFRKTTMNHMDLPNNNYLVQNNDYKLSLDMNQVKANLMEYKNENDIYTSSSNLLKELLKEGYIVHSGYIGLSDTDTSSIKEKISFKDAFIKYANLKKNPFLDFFDVEKKILENTHPILSDAYSKLGEIRVKELKYDSYHVKKELDRYIDAPIGVKITNRIKMQLELNEPIEKSDAKKALQDIYNYFGLQGKIAKTTDYEKWFNVRETRVTINGKRVECIILTEKVI